MLSHFDLSYAGAHGMQLARWASWARGTSPMFSGRPYDPTVPLVFMHIPKTSGNAVTSGLRMAIKPQRDVVGLTAYYSARLAPLTA